jgi:hypothetical protein
MGEHRGGAFVGEIQDYGRSWPPRRRRRAWLSRAGNVLLLPFAALIGLGLYLSGAFGVASIFNFASAGAYQFAPSMFSVDRDCSDFRTRDEAQAFFRAAGPGDPHRLDRDGDGRACELNGR